MGSNAQTTGGAHKMNARMAVVVTVLLAVLALKCEGNWPLAEEPWQREALGFRVDAVVIHPAYAYAEPVIAKVVITNVTKQSRRFTTHIGPEIWIVRGHNQLGDPTDATWYGRFVVGELPDQSLDGRIDLGTMAPGQTRTFYVPLNALADLTMQGTYTMEIGLPFTDATGEGAILSSGPLVFQVSDWAGKATKAAILEFDEQNPTADVARKVAEQIRPDLEELASYAKPHQPAALRAEARTQLQKLSDLIAASLKGAPSPEKGGQ